MAVISGYVQVTVLLLAFYGWGQGAAIHHVAFHVAVHRKAHTTNIYNNKLNKPGSNFKTHGKENTFFNMFATRQLCEF